MSTPTPDPRPEWITAAAEAIEEAAWPRIGRDLGTIHRDEIVAAGLRAALPQIRAEVAEEIAGMLVTFAANRREQNPKDLVAAAYLAAARHVREYAVDPAVRPAVASAVPAEGSGQGPEPCPSCGATVWPAGTPWTDSYRRLVLGKFPEGSGHPQPADERGTPQELLARMEERLRQDPPDVPRTANELARASVEASIRKAHPQSRLDRMRVAPGVYCADPTCQLHPHAEGASE